ncbi:hypothetical protein [Acidisphaera sp. S103]|uniref:hypothetical protein n=1 Tax=Acidisphaera sp. S103 TaxID=1747223 RepID=UPI00131BB59F|nr:hypothetical protein [Acidisphaera sp. S103]
MLIPKVSHLVERAAERLLRSGAREDSSAQLMRQPGVDTALDTADHNAEAATSGAASMRSSLFAPPLAPVKSPLPGAMPTAAEAALAGLGAPPEEGVNAADDGHGLPTPPLAVPAIQAQPRPAAVLDRPEDFTAAAPLRGVLADPAVGMLLGPASVDAVSLERAGMVDCSRTGTRVSRNSGWCSPRSSALPSGRVRNPASPICCWSPVPGPVRARASCRYADRLLILDAPPCLSTSDPAVLARVAGQILFVVEADRTQRDEIEASLDLIQACPTITMVLNKQQISSRYTFGAYSSYYSS